MPRNALALLISKWILRLRQMRVKIAQDVVDELGWNNVPLEKRRPITKVAEYIRKHKRLSLVFVSLNYWIFKKISDLF